MRCSSRARSTRCSKTCRGAPLLLLLDGVTDPHNLGACLRVADGAGAHAVIAPKDHAVGINATVAKVASGAAETVPYLMVTNLSRCIGELKAQGIRVVGTADDAPQTLHEADLRGPLALVLGAEGKGLRQLTRSSCDALVRIPMYGAVESLNVSVAAGVCLLRGAGASAVREEPMQARARAHRGRALVVRAHRCRHVPPKAASRPFATRSTGLWSRFDPAQLASEEGFRADPALVWDWYAERRDWRCVRVQPNAGHVALGDFARRRPGVLTLVSQNVDDLHQRAGNADTIRLHGELLADRWLERCTRSPACDTGEAEPGRPPRCGRCGNLVRPAVVWFGEMLPAAALEAAEQAARSCDVALIVGTSGAVWPAAGLAALARRAARTWPSSIRTTARSTTRPTWCCARPPRRRCRNCLRTG